MKDTISVYVWISDTDFLSYETTAAYPEDVWLIMMNDDQDYVRFGTYIIAKSKIRYIEIIQ